MLDVTKKTRFEIKLLLLIGIVFCVFGTIAFIIAFIGMRHNIGLGVFNLPIHNFMVNLREPVIVSIAKFVTSLASFWIFALIAVFIAVWGVIRKQVWQAGLIITVIITSALTSLTLKALIMDARPPLADMVPTFEMDFSFPSGHTLSTITLLLVVGYTIYSRKFTWARFSIWIAIALLGTGIIALTRLYLGYHWLTDVVASFGLGFIILSILMAFDLIASRKVRKSKEFSLDTAQ